VIRAIGVHRFGGPEVVGVIERPRPDPGPNEVVVRVVAASVNPVDVGLRTGRQSEALAAAGLRPRFIPGMELAGVVARVGVEVERSQVGDRVAGIVTHHQPQGGAQAEELLVRPVSDPSARRDPVRGRGDRSDERAHGVDGAVVARPDARRPPRSDRVRGRGGANGVQLAAHQGIHVVAKAAPYAHAELLALGAQAVVERGPDSASRIAPPAPRKQSTQLSTLRYSRRLPSSNSRRRPAGATAGPAGRPRAGGITARLVKVTEHLEAKDALFDLMGRVGKR
jgi:hypothetical protein